MIRFQKAGWLSALLIIFLMGLALVPARADVSYNFNNGNDNGLTRYDPLAPYGSNSTFTFPVLGPGNDGYRLTSGPSADPDDLGPSRVGSVAENATFTNFRESVDLVSWDNTVEQGLGLVARASNVGLGTSDAYYLHYNTNVGGSQSGLSLDRIDQEFPTVSGFTSMSPLDPSVGYRLVFTGIGATLTGQIFTLSDLIDPLATVTLTDTTYQSGFAGVLTTGLIGGNNTGVDTTFDNFSAQSVPEPAAMIMIVTGLGAVSAGGMLRRGRRRFAAAVHRVR